MPSAEKRKENSLLPSRSSLLHNFSFLFIYFVPLFCSRPALLFGQVSELSTRATLTFARGPERQGKGEHRNDFSFFVRLSSPCPAIEQKKLEGHCVCSFPLPSRAPLFSPPLSPCTSSLHSLSTKGSRNALHGDVQIKKQGPFFFLLSAGDRWSRKKKEKTRSPCGCSSGLSLSLSFCFSAPRAHPFLLFETKTFPSEEASRQWTKGKRRRNRKVSSSSSSFFIRVFRSKKERRRRKSVSSHADPCELQRQASLCRCLYAWQRALDVDALVY